ncbi:uncharacterized protein LOC117042534 [Lacerta agilis]|uniref:uncharacterized protein LOC117042534 n=1 Tax=Lacerta agilis TaxID=80427 RepID=UPI001419319E|nr:uncharacterized protein LOC117042534 [Lacerta agilis]
MGVLLRWAPLILWAAAHLLLLLDCAGSTSHSLRYFYTAVSDPGQGLPQFIAVGYVDDQQFIQYDSDTKEALPRVPWIRKVEKDNPQYWQWQTQISQGSELAFREGLHILRNRYNQSGGIHTIQRMYGCELGSGRKGGYNQHGYDGRDFIAFDKETLTWTAADTGAQVTKRKLDANMNYNKYQKEYLEEACIEWLQKYLDYGKETLLRTEAPEVKVTRKAHYDNLETLVCQVHGFYPKEIDANWVKDGEVWHEGTSRGLVAPNSDGTYYVLLSVKIDPEERDRFRCRVEHDSLEKPLDVAWEKEPVNLGLIVGAILGVLTAIVLVSGIIFFISRKRSEKLAYKAASVSDRGSDSSSSESDRGSDSSDRSNRVHHLRLEFCQATDSATCPEFCDWRNISLSPNPGSRCWWFRRRGRERASERQRKKDVAGEKGIGSPFFGRGEMGVLFRWPPLILWAAAHLLLLDCAGSTSHSMRYYFTGVSEPGQGLPQFISVGYVDDQLFIQYDSDTKEKLPRVPWIRKAEKEDPQYWHTETQHMQYAELVYKGDLQTLQNRYNQSGGIHTIQMLFGCEWSPGRSNGGLWQYAYDGRDFIAFDKQTLTWTAADMGAQVTKRKWDADLAWNKYWKAYLEETCIEWLQRYLDYGKETLQRTEAPEVKVTRKAGYDNLETLICQVHGFYPKEIDANWMKDGEVWYEGTSRGLVAPNSDGTYYVLLSVKIDPEERDRFRCRVEHDSLEKPLDVAWEKEPGERQGNGGRI